MIKYSYAIILTIVIFAGAAAVNAQTGTRISATWQVQNYDISASLPQDAYGRDMTVTAQMALKNVSRSPASTLTLRLSGAATISKISIDGTGVDFTKAEEKLGSTSLQRIGIRVRSVLPDSTLPVTVEYSLNVKENSGLASISPVGAQFLPTSFWYPTPNSWFFPRGADHAPFKIKVSGNAGKQLVSAGRGPEGSTLAAENKLYGQPFFVLGNWMTVRSGDVITLIPEGSNDAERKRAEELAELATQARDHASRFLGPFPDAQLRLVTVRRGGGFASGGAILLEESVLRRGKIDSIAAMNIADGIAKVWLANNVLVSGDGFGVIHEGLTRYIATKFIESKFGKDAADVERVRQRTAYAAVVHRDSPLTMASPLDDYYYPEVANKGAMIWHLMARKVGEDKLFEVIRSMTVDRVFSLEEFRAGFTEHKDFLDTMFDQVTETNLQAGLPLAGEGEWKVNVRNTGPIDTTVNVRATLENNERMTMPVTIRPKSFGEVSFKTPQKIVRVEIDPEKLYPQTDYSDDIAPRETTDSDPLLAVKRLFDKQEFAAAEKMARSVLTDLKAFDDVRILLARSLLGQNKDADAEREFRKVLEDPIPSPRSLAWANSGLAEIMVKGAKGDQAASFAADAIRADGEYGASVSARNTRNRTDRRGAVDESVKAFFTEFDRTAVTNRKADIDRFGVSGEASRFLSGITGQVVEWRTNVKHVDRLDLNNILVETELSIKLLNRENETGMAVYRLTKVGSDWKLSSVDVLEVR